MRAREIRFNFDGALRNLMLVGNVFVRYRYQKPSFFRSRLSSVVGWKVKGRIVSERKPELSQQRKSVGRKRKAEETENNIED
jgi:hypothetical protein